MVVLLVEALLGLLKVSIVARFPGVFNVVKMGYEQS